MVFHGVRRRDAAGGVAVLSLFRGTGPGSVAQHAADGAGVGPAAGPAVRKRIIWSGTTRPFLILAARPLTQAFERCAANKKPRIAPGLFAFRDLKSQYR